MQIELKRIQREVGITTIFVTHDQEEAITLSDNIGILDKGILIQEGSPSEVYEHPNSEFIATFLGDSNIIPVKRNEGGFRLSDGSPIQIDHENSVLPDKFKVCIRAEKIFILEGEKNGSEEFQNQYDVEIEQSFFAGKSLTYLVGLAGLKLRVFQQNATGERYAEGNRIKIAWKSSDMNFIEK